MGDPNPVDDDELYDCLYVGDGVESPGQVKSIAGHDRKVNWDVKTAKGQKGATTELKDIPPIEFTITFYLADRDDFDAWPEFRDVLLSTVNGPKPKALDVYHPDLAANDINSVVLASLGGAIHDGKGGQSYAVKLQEYKPPKPKGGSPNGSSSTAKKGSAPDPNAAANAELAALTQQYKDTKWG